MKRFFSKYRRDDSGVVAVEFAFFAPIIISSIGLMAMYGMVTYDKMRMNAGTRAIMQYVLVGGSDTTTMEAIMYQSSGIQATVSVSTYCACSGAKDSSLSCNSEGTCASGTKNEYKKVTATTTKNYLLRSWELQSDIDFRMG